MHYLQQLLFIYKSPTKNSPKLLAKRKGSFATKLNIFDQSKSIRLQSGTAHTIHNKMKSCIFLIFFIPNKYSIN